MTRLLAAALAGLIGLTATPPRLQVRQREGLVHGFLVLRGADGAIIANGDLLQTVRGDVVTSRLVFHFKDGSLNDETSVFSQRGALRLLRDHLTQHGPSFPTAIDMTIDTAAGSAAVRYDDGHGKKRIARERLKAPAAIANGILLVALKNIAPGASPPDLSLVVATPKPRVVALHITAAGKVPFTTGTLRREAEHYVVQVDLGGLAGVVAPLIGKQPPDSHVWILEGDAPAFVRAEQPFYAGAPLWTIELVGPAWPSGSR